MHLANPHIRARTLLRLGLALVVLAGAAWATRAVRADNDGVYLTIKAGQPDKLVADGKSRTVLEANIDPAAACWKQTVDAEGTFSLQVSTSLGTIAPTVAGGKLAQFPMPLTLTAGTTAGTALVQVRAYYCAPGAIGAFGVCTDQQSQQNVCLADTSISIGDAPQPPPEEKPPESTEFSAALTCAPPNPDEGAPVVCTVKVEGARPNESFEFRWYVDTALMATTSTPSWTWGKAVAGPHTIGVDVLGDARSQEPTTSINVRPKAEEQAPKTEGQPAQPGAQPPPPGGGQPPQPGGQPPQPGEGQEPGGAEPPDVRQPERPFKPSRDESAPGMPDPGEGGSPGAGGVDARVPVEQLIEGAESRTPTARGAAIAALTSATAVAAKLMLDLEALKRKPERVRDTTPDLPESGAPVDGSDALNLGVEARGPDLPPVRGDVLGRAPDTNRQALDRTVNGVPAALRESEQWKQRIAPLLDQAKRWDDPARLRALDERIQAIVNLRRQIDSNPAYRKLPKHHQDALIWKRRGDGALGAVRPQDRERLFTAPSKKPTAPVGASRPPAGSAARTPEKEVEFIDDLRKYPVRRIESPFRAQQRRQGSDPMTRDLWKYRRVDPHRKGFESGWDKAKRLRRELGAWWDEVRFGIPRKRGED